MAGFAGSQHSDERRRRRLAVEQDGAAPRAENSNSARPDRDAEPVTLVNLTVGELIPRPIWLHLAFTFLLAVLVFGGEYAVTQIPKDSKVNAEAIRVTFAEFQDVLGALCLCSATFLAYVIRLTRGRSQNDFNGRYRLWNWVIAAFAFGSVSLFLDIHHLGSELLAVLLKKPQLASDALTWQVPLLSLGGLLYLRLRREMRESRLTSVLLHLSVICYAVALISGIEAVTTNSILHIPQATLTACGFWAALSGHLLLFATMSLHARYVLHVNPETPTCVIRQFRVFLPRLRILRWVRLPRFKMPSMRLKRAPQAKSAPSVVATEQLPPPAEATQTETAAPVKKKKRATTKRKSRIEPAHTDSVVEPPKIATAAPATEPLRASQRPIEEQIDDPPSDELKGLSKKQRRELRKKRRESQRALQRG